MLRGKRIAVVVAAIAVVAGGCGGDGDDEGTSSSPLTKAQFVKQADAICSKAQKEKEAKLLAGLKKFEKEPGNPTSKEQEDLVLEILPPIKRMTEELAELGAPSGDEEKIEEIVSSFESDVQDVEDDPGSALTASPFEESDELAQKYGLSACSQF